MPLTPGVEHTYNGEVRDPDGRLIVVGSYTSGGTTADPVNSAGVATPIKFVRINASSSGDNTIVAAVATKKIRVLGYAMVATGTVTALFQDSAGSPVIFGGFDLIANSGVSYAGGLLAPAFDTAAGNGLEINLSAGVAVKGHLTYIEV